MIYSIVLRYIWPVLRSPGAGRMTRALARTPEEPEGVETRAVLGVFQLSPFGIAPAGGRDLDRHSRQLLAPFNPFCRNLRSTASLLNSRNASAAIHRPARVPFFRILSALWIASRFNRIFRL